MKNRSTWIPVEDERPPFCGDILFTDGQKIYFGWLETYERLEEPCFVAKTSGVREDSSPEGITHWMRLPALPKSD
jgi:hypothetical protein